MSHAQFIEELQKEGDAWRITVRGIGLANVLASEMFASGVPYPITISEDVIQDQPDLIGSFLIRGLTPDVLTQMSGDYAEKFRDAGLRPADSSLSLEGGPRPGVVRTWLEGTDQSFDMTEQEVKSLYVDNWADVILPDDLTVWDTIDDRVITFTYTNGARYEIKLSSIEKSQTAADRLLNRSNYLIIPADQSLTPVFSARTVPNMFALRLDLLEAEGKVKAQQLEIGYMVNEFRKIIAKYSDADWKNPVGVFRDGLGGS